ncbi:MAG: hypothetical protein P8K08_06185 [Fuerstiella sp.]|jgi:hypothetical protein|nr:hypothetical protein [Fuerstiella sp.]
MFGCSPAMMKHSNIARIFDTGMTREGRPDSAMELVRGFSIDNIREDTGLALHYRRRLVPEVFPDGTQLVSVCMNSPDTACVGRDVVFASAHDYTTAMAGEIINDARGPFFSGGRRVQM